MQDQELENYFTAIKEDFNSMHERFDGMDRRFDVVDSRLDGIDRRIDGMDRRFDRIESICFSILEVVKGQDLKFRDMNQRLLLVEKRCL